MLFPLDNRCHPSVRLSGFSLLYLLQLSTQRSTWPRMVYFADGLKEGHLHKSDTRNWRTTSKMIWSIRSYVEFQHTDIARFQGETTGITRGVTRVSRTTQTTGREIRILRGYNPFLVLGSTPFCLQNSLYALVGISVGSV